MTSRPLTAKAWSRTVSAVILTRGPLATSRFSGSRAASGGATREEVRQAVARPRQGRPKHFTFAYRPPTKLFNLKLSFNKARASRDEIIDALEGIIRDLRKK